MIQGNWTKIVHSKASGTWLGQINGFGEVAGYYQDNKGNDYGFVYSEATGFTPINCPSGSTQISGINNNDQVVGNCGDGMYGSMFIYDMAHGTFTTIISPAQAGYVEPSGINDQNVVVGRCQASPCVSGNGYEDGFYEVPNP